MKLIKYLLYNTNLYLLCFCSLEPTLVVNGMGVIMEGRITVVMGMVHRRAKIPCMVLEQLMVHPPMDMGIMSNQLAEL